METTINNNERSEKEVKRRIRQAKKVFRFKCKLLTSKNAAIKTGKPLIKTYALSMVVKHGRCTKMMKLFRSHKNVLLVKNGENKMDGNEQVLDLVKEKRTLLNNSIR